LTSIQFTFIDLSKGRVTNVHFTKDPVDEDELFDDPEIERPPLHPEEILLSNAKAPQLIQDDPDPVYERWTRNLPPQLKLPDSDLLQAIHAYASDYYSVSPGGDIAYGSMDGTALIAIGMLLEEMSAEALGETGHLALLESVREQEEQVPTLINGKRVTESQNAATQFRTKLKPSVQTQINKVKSSASRHSPQVIPKKEESASAMNLSD
jgi:hypothetical protein